MSQHPQGKTLQPLALVTGAAGIIGPAITSELRAKGWRVIATDRKEECFDLYEKAHGEPVQADHIIFGDLGSQASCNQLVQRIEKDHGALTAIVNGAAFNNQRPVEAITEQDAQQLLAVNFLAPLFLTQAALPSLAKNRGAVVNLSSVLIDEPRAGGLLYACSKVALEKSTQIIAHELIRQEVRINNIRIGRVPGYAFLRNKIKDLPADLAQQMVRELLHDRLMEMEGQFGRQAIGRPEEIAHAVSFLLSPQARFINGQTLVLDGGYFSAPTKPNTAAFEERISAWLNKHEEQNLYALPK